MQYLYLTLILCVYKQTLMSVLKELIIAPRKTPPQQSASTHMVDSFAHVYNTWDTDCMTLDVKVLLYYLVKLPFFKNVHTSNST